MGRYAASSRPAFGRIQPLADRVGNRSRLPDPSREGRLRCYSVGLSEPPGQKMGSSCRCGTAEPAKFRTGAFAPAPSKTLWRSRRGFGTSLDLPKLVATLEQTGLYSFTAKREISLLWPAIDADDLDERDAELSPSSSSFSVLGAAAIRSSRSLRPAMSAAGAAPGGGQILASNPPPLRRAAFPFVVLEGRDPPILSPLTECLRLPLRPVSGPSPWCPARPP